MKLLDQLREIQADRHLQGMEALDRLSEATRLRYPRHHVGVGSHGIPEVLEFDRQAQLHIGAYTSIGSGVKILLGSPRRSDWLTTYPFPDRLEKLGDIGCCPPGKGDVSIGSDCWIGANALIQAGVSIGHGAVIAAGSVVSQDVEPYAVVGGNPCVFLHWRFEGPLREQMLAAAWWDWPVDEVKSVAHYLCRSDPESFLTYARRRQEAQAMPVG